MPFEEQPDALPLQKTSLTPIAFDPAASQQVQQLSPDASEMQWTPLYNEHLLLTVQAINQVRLAFMTKLS
jgi:hypothetical protein